MLQELFLDVTADWFAKTLGEPTKVQKTAWPVIAAGQDVLVSAPTGTGKTLTAFLWFIDRLKKQAREGVLEEGLQLLYLSPLKSLAADIWENLRRPLEGIAQSDGEQRILVQVRTGDTESKERQRMYKHPPHILITTPESLFLMLTSAAGRKMLEPLQAVIVDEMHALIDTKRGAHLLFSLARLDRLCGRKLQRIGLSATIEPLELAARWLSVEGAAVVAPAMSKKRKLYIEGTQPQTGRFKDPVWEELAGKVYEQCLQADSVIAFCEARRYAEKLAYYVNQLGGPDFARVHHGSLSKEQREETEALLREGKLRLLCATSSMELGIDVGDIDRVLQVGCPRTVSGCLQRLGRAGHNPGRVSVMHMYSRSAQENLKCGMTARLVMEGAVEEARPPRLCLDVLAQHIVSMAAADSFSAEEVLELCEKTWTFQQVTKEQVIRLFCMLAGDYEHRREIPVRPRILYDRLAGKVHGDPYSRMLACAAGGTIPDKGLFVAKTAEGAVLGELDEEFVYESRIGDKFLLGAFGWKILSMDKNTVVVEPAKASDARLPFWHGELGGRDLKTGLAFGRMLRELAEAESGGCLEKRLADMGLDPAAVQSASCLLLRQIESTGCLPDDRTIIAEHFTDSAGCQQIMFHSVFGRRVNAPLALLAARAASDRMGSHVGSVDEEDGFLLYPYGEQGLPEHILYGIDLSKVRAYLETILPKTPLFSFTFRYNAGRALMMGMHRNSRQPLWVQRLRSTQLLEESLKDAAHPLIEETRRECLEDLWDIEGVCRILADIRAGLIRVREVYTDVPSPMSLPLQWQVQAAEMYSYAPTTPGILQEADRQMENALSGAGESGMTGAAWETGHSGIHAPGAQLSIVPTREALEAAAVGGRIPQNPEELHTLLMIEGDLEAGEVPVPIQWLEELAAQSRACYIEPGLWIAAEQRADYEGDAAEEAGAGAEERSLADTAGDCTDGAGEGTARLDARAGILRRMLYYRGGKTLTQMVERYFWSETETAALLALLLEKKEIVEDAGVFYHAKRYEKAQRITLKGLREEVRTQPFANYAALLAQRAMANGDAKEQTRESLRRLSLQAFPAAAWETILLPARVKNYREAHLDGVLAEGELFWRMEEDGTLFFATEEQIDWDAELPEAEEPADAEATEPLGATGASGVKLSRAERLIYEELRRKGASFLKPLMRALGEGGDAQGVLLDLAQKGLVCADTFLPVRQLKNRKKLAQASLRQQIGARVKTMSAGRFDLVRPLRLLKLEEWIEKLFDENLLLCRETWRKPPKALGENGYSWADALMVLRVWEYAGRIRRGYFVAGMSGAQFVRDKDYPAFVAKLAAPDAEILWLHATDPALAWGRCCSGGPQRGFLQVPQTAVCLVGGEIGAIVEKSGRSLRIFAEARAEEMLNAFSAAFKTGRIFADKKRLTVKEYPDGLSEVFKAAGFIREMQDFTVYK